MSASSSNSSKHLSRIAQRAHAALKPRRTYRWSALLALPLWVLVAFISSQVVVIGVLRLFAWLGVPLEDFVSGSASQAVLAALVYTLTLIVTIGVPYAVWRQKSDLTLLGINRLPSWGDIGLAPLGFIAYAILVTLVLGAVTTLFVDFPSNQAQDVGFQLGSRLDNFLAFATLVVLAPIAEEILFRGYLYGKLKGYVPGLVAAIVTSVLFGAVHGQLNVAIDVFVLSLILCGLRSLTGSIWAGVLVHMIKNSIAYYILFVVPLIGG